MSCENHKKELFGQADMKVVARATADMHYGALMEFLHELSKCIDADAEKDNEIGLEKNASALQYLGMSLFESALRAEKVWNICKPHMESKYKNR